MSVFSTQKVDHLSQKIFFGESVNIARYEQVKYPQLDKLTEKMLSFFWQPQEIDLTRDQKDFKSLTDNEKHIFTSNLKRQIILDSVQGRAPSLAFLPICSLPEVETLIQTWAFTETIHSKSYTHIIRNVYPNPSKVFDEILEIEEIVDCAKDISKYYDRLIEDAFATYCFFDERPGRRELKKSLWLCLNAVNALEGIRFYVSFSCALAFAELKKMEGNASIIALILRDENIHLAITQQLLKLLPKEDSDFEIIKKETEEEVKQIFLLVVEQEKKWAEYLFKDGSMIGLNYEVLASYVDWIAAKRASAIGIRGVFGPSSNPLPWMQKWVSSESVQKAPQQTTLNSYTTGGIHQDMTEDTFSGFKL